MKFETRFETDTKDEMDRLAPVTAAVIQTTLPRAGWHNACTEAARQAGLTGTITYEDGTSLDVGDPGNFQKMMQMRRDYKQANGERPATNQIFKITADVDNPELFWQIWEQQGGGGERGNDVVGATNKKVIKPGAKPADTPKDEKVVSDQHAPVESKLKPKDEMEKEADRRKIIRVENPDGTKSEEIVEETGDLAFDNSPKDEPKAEKTEEPKAEEPEAEEPKAEEEEATEDKKEKVPAFAATENSEKKLLEAFALADEAVDLGLIAKEEKLTYVAKLEKESMEQIESRRDVHELVKKAGLTKQTRVAGLRNLPRVAATHTSTNGSVSNLSGIDDADLFL